MTEQSKERFKVIPAVYLLPKRDDDILLLERANSGYMDGMFSLVAGHVEPGELSKAAMIREAKEEVGIVVEEEDLVLVHIAHRLDSDRIDLFFSTERWQGEPRICEPEKCTNLAWGNVANLPENMIPFIKNVIEAVEDGIVYSEYESEP